MDVQRHEIPTHLHVEDKLLLGLSAGQAMLLLAGLCGAYGLFQQWPALPLGVRLGLAAAAFLLAAALALVRPQGRGLPEWAVAALRYLARPRASVWRPSEPDPLSARPEPAAKWEPLVPRRAWRESEP